MNSLYGYFPDYMHQWLYEKDDFNLLIKDNAPAEIKQMYERIIGIIEERKRRWNDFPEDGEGMISGISFEGFIKNKEYWKEAIRKSKEEYFLILPSGKEINIESDSEIWEMEEDEILALGEI